MKLSYLCPNHRNWLFSNCQRAEYYWHTWMDTADYFCQTGQIEQAIPYLGCAFELAEHSLTHRAPDHSLAIHRFTYNSLLLAMAYQYEGDVDSQNTIVKQALERLEKELAFPGLSGYVSRCMQRLFVNQTESGFIDPIRQCFEGPKAVLH